MKRIQNLGGLSDAAAVHCQQFFTTHSDEAIAANPRKAQLVFKTSFEGTDWIVKRYDHRAIQHRLASFINQTNADRYARIAKLLAENGIDVPTPLLIAKHGRQLLPDQTLLVMERVEGTMLRDLLPELDHDRERTEKIAEKISYTLTQMRKIGIVHRDLNSKNLLVTAKNAITLIDFDYAGQNAPQSSGFMRRHRRDVETLLGSCQSAPNFARTVSTLLSHA